MLTPQTHDGTLEAFAKAESVEGGIPGGAVGGVVGGLPSAPAAAPAPAPLMDARSRENTVVESLPAAPVAARGQELGDLFQYTLTQPITVRRNQSALVPIVQADVAIERVSLWSAASATARPWRAVWLTNDTGLTLDGGSVALVEGGAFAGEGLLEAIQPGERRLISYAVDLAARVSVDARWRAAARQPHAHRQGRLRAGRAGTRHEHVHHPQRGQHGPDVRDRTCAPRRMVPCRGHRDAC